MKRSGLLILSIFISILLQAQTFSGGGGLIPDDGSTSIDFPINVGGLVPAVLNGTHGIETVCITVNHDWDADLQISLISPSGTQITLVSGAGGSGDDFTNTCFNQSSTNLIMNGNPPFTGTFKPMGNLGYFNTGQVGNGVWKLHILDDAPQDQGTLLSWSITFGNSPVVAAPFTASNLPIVIINTNNQNIPDEPKIQASMGIVYNGAGQINHTTDPYNNYNGKIGIELRGSSSQGFPKKSYGIELWDNSGADTSLPLLGMPKESDWVLSASYSDKSLLNNVLAYKLYNDFGSYAPRTRFVELVLNNQYKGVYILMEKIKRDTNRVDIAKLGNNDTAGSAVTGGYILKIDKTTGGGGDGFESNYLPLANGNGQTIYFLYDYPSDADINAKQKAYIEKYVDSFELALHSLPLYDTNSGWRHYADEASFVRYLLLNEVSKNVDGYRISTYLYKKKDTKGNKIYVGPPWDYDIAFGNANYCDGDVDTGWAFNFGDVCGSDGYQIPFWWPRLMQDTSFKNRLKCEWSTLRTGILDTVKLFAWIDSVATVLSDAKDRNFDTWPILGSYVWPNPSPVPTSYAGEIAELKQWMKNRIGWLDANIPGTCWPPPPPPLSVENGNFLLQCSVSPNPFHSTLELRLTQNKPQRYRVSLLSIDGRMLLSKELSAPAGESIERLQCPQLAGGIYFLHIQSSVGEKTFKLIRQ